jgi:hypothetical protein
MKSLCCANKHRPPSGKGEVGAIIRHGFYTTRSGKVVATSAGVVGRRSARQLGNLIIDFSTGVRSLMRWLLSVSKV